MKNFLTTMIIVFLTWIKPYGQDYYCNCNISASDNIIDVEKKLSGRVFISNFINYSSQFYHKWAKGDIILCDGTVLKNKDIRYNQYLDELIWSRNSDYKAAIADKQSISGFVIYNDDNTPFAQFKKVNIKNWYASDTADIYLQVLTEGDVSLYVLRRIELIKNVIYNGDRYYLLIDNSYYLFRPSRLVLLRFFPESKKEFRKIFRKNNLYVRHETDLVKAIKLYNNSIYEGE